MFVMVLDCAAGGQADPASASGTTATEKFPNKPIVITVTANPGGDTDGHARKIASLWEKELGQPVIVANMAGAGGSVAARHVLNSPADGYNLLWQHVGIITAEMVGVSNIGFDAFENVAIPVVDDSALFVVSGKSPYNSLPDFVKALKESPKSLKYSCETGSPSHIIGLVFQQAAGVDLNIVDIGNAAQMTAALLGGQVHLGLVQYVAVKNYIANGDLRALAVLSDDRLAAIPDIPTAKEQGVDMKYLKLFGFFAPPKTPNEVVDTLNITLKKVIESSAFQDYCKDIAYVKGILYPGQEAVKIWTEQRDFYNRFKSLFANSKK
jgi:tripartite-type tricarboxylate transporter receptor subunit TctC